MKTEQAWELYQANSKKASQYSVLLATILTCFNLYTLQFSIFLSIFWLLHIGQYTYLTVYYEFVGNYSEFTGRAVDRTFMHILPSIIMFYGKIVVLLLHVF